MIGSSAYLGSAQKKSTVLSLASERKGRKDRASEESEIAAAAVFCLRSIFWPPDDDGKVQLSYKGGTGRDGTENIYVAGWTDMPFFSCPPTIHPSLLATHAWDEVGRRGDAFGEQSVPLTIHGTYFKYSLPP